MRGIVPISQTRPRVYDQRVRTRIERGAGMSAGDMIALQAARRAIIADMDIATTPFDAVAMPTAPIAPPTIDSLTDDADFTHVNALALRNTALGNFLDRCAISLPMQRGGRGAGRVHVDGRYDGGCAAVRHRRRNRSGNQGVTTMIRVLVCLFLLASVPAHAQSVLSEILSRGTLRVGLTGDYRPFSIKEADGKFTGLDVDEAEALAKGMGVKLEVVPTAWPNLMADLMAHKFDVGMGGITVTLDRAKTAYFSTPVMRSGKTPIARCTDKGKFDTLEQIDKPGVKVIVNPGGTNERFAKARVHQAEIVMFPNNATIFEEIVAGHAT